VEAQDGGNSPSHSIWPVGIAVGIAVLLVGLAVSSWWTVGAGALVVAFALLGWLIESSQSRPDEPAPAGEPGPEPELSTYSRSKFLESSTLAVGAVVGAGIAVPVIGFAVVGPFLRVKQFEVDLGPVANFPQDQWLITSFLLDPAQGDVTGRTAFVRNNGKIEVDGRKVDSFTIISNHCVHLGCPVQPNGPTGNPTVRGRKDGQQIRTQPVTPSGFGCPCHGGNYDSEGNRTAGPPVRALDRYDYSIRAGRLILGKPYSVGSVSGEGGKALIRKYGFANPGQHVDGWEQILYPLQPPHN
jgi:menaquinol-cytochrome c reductase iron-sulfur subunit